MRLPILALAAVASTSSLAGTSGRQFVATKRVQLVELFTSEGCSSCPPAEDWLNSLAGSKGLWRDFVPVAFHVDYWNYIGWTDVFSRPAYTQRQHSYGRYWSESSVYTPAVVVDGHAWSGWRQSPKLPTSSEGAVIPLTLTETGPRRFTLDVGAPGRKLTAHAVLLARGVRTKVTGGENAGRTLPHDFAVVSLVPVTLRPSKTGGLQGTIEFKDVTDVKAASYAVAAWIARDGSPEPVQAVGGPL